MFSYVDANTVLKSETAKTGAICKLLKSRVGKTEGTEDYPFVHGKIDNLGIKIN